MRAKRATIDPNEAARRLRALRSRCPACGAFGTAWLKDIGDPCLNLTGRYREIYERQIHLERFPL